MQRWIEALEEATVTPVARLPETRLSRRVRVEGTPIHAPFPTGIRLAWTPMPTHPSVSRCRVSRTTVRSRVAVEESAATPTDRLFETTH